MHRRIMETSAPFGWSDRFTLGFALMDHAHEEFVLLVGALKQCRDADLPAALREFERHALEHFSQENEWMESHNFPARKCHIAEHDAVLGSVRGIRRRAEAGDLSCVRRLAVELERWFPSHVDHLDSALAHWMCKQTYGAVPVVVRRDVTATAS